LALKFAPIASEKSASLDQVYHLVHVRNHICVVRKRTVSK